MTTIARFTAILALAAFLCAPGCKKQSDKPADKGKPAAAAPGKSKTGTANQSSDPYEETQKDAKLDKSLEAITKDSATEKAPDAEQKPAVKDDPKTAAAKDQIIKKLLPAMNVDRQIDMLRQMFAQDTAQLFMEYIQQSAYEKGLATEENGKILDQNLPQYMEKLMSSAAQLIDNKEITSKILTPAYKEKYTAEELQGMLDFFNSPAGKAYMEQNPAINQTLHQTIIKQKSDKVQALIKETGNAVLSDLKPAAKSPKKD
jgi:hypothetical protein